MDIEKGNIMKVYGADFSGAVNPGRGIYYAEGFLSGGSLEIIKVAHCEDRLDLFTAVHGSNAPWGLDFPFSLTMEAYKTLNAGSRQDFSNKLLFCPRRDYYRWIEGENIPTCEARCKELSLCCRAGDAAVNAFSPLKRTNPNMLAMTYAGLKFLAYLQSLGVAVYPFDRLNTKASRVYEVYPSHTWKQLGLSCSIDFVEFKKRFGRLYGLALNFADEIQVDSLDAADAVAACITMAYAIYHLGIEEDWTKQHSWVRDIEWERRFTEGLIVRI